MIVIGMGTTTSVTDEQIVSAITHIEEKIGRPADRISLLSRGDIDHVIGSALRSLGRLFVFMDVSDLKGRADECVTHSEVSLAAYGVPSVSEAAALAGAGAQSRLTIPRLTFKTVTVAVAQAPALAANATSASERFR